MDYHSFLLDYAKPQIVKLTPNVFAAQFRLMKLLPAQYILDRAAEREQLVPGGHIVETSSGTFALALAMLSAVRGYRLTIVSATSLMDTLFQIRLEQLGASVVLVEDKQRTGNQDGRLRKLHGILAEQPHSYWPSQYDNPDNPAAYSRLAETVVEKLGHVDVLIGCVGSGGSLCGTARYLRLFNPDLYTIAVDTHNSVLFGQEVGPRLLRGLGNSILPKNLDHALVNEVHWVGAFQAFSATRRLYRERAMFMGPTSGAAAIVGYWYGQIHPEKTAVVIMADEGYRYQSTVYADDWLEDQDGWLSHQIKEPVKLKQVKSAGESEWTFIDWSDAGKPGHTT